jgi:CTP-dependent riboflavin kinase
VARLNRGNAVRTLKGMVDDGYGLASANLAPVMVLIESRMGLTRLVAGTLNVRILEDYIVKADAVISPAEYPLNKEKGTNETIKLQRCLVRGRKAAIMRPDTHETHGWGNGVQCLELMAAEKLRDTLGLTNGSVVDVEVEGDDAWWASGSNPVSHTKPQEKE